MTAINNGLAGGSIGAVGDAAGKPIAKSEGIPWDVLVHVLGAFVLVLGWSVGAIYMPDFVIPSCSFLSVAWSCLNVLFSPIRRVFILRSARVMMTADFAICAL